MVNKYFQYGGNRSSLFIFLDYLNVVASVPLMSSLDL